MEEFNLPFLPWIRNSSLSSAFTYLVTCLQFIQKCSDVHIHTTPNFRATSEILWSTHEVPQTHQHRRKVCALTPQESALTKIRTREWKHTCHVNRSHIIQINDGVQFKSTKKAGRLLNRLQNISLAVQWRPLSRFWYRYFNYRDAQNWMTDTWVPLKPKTRTQCTV